jgi:acetyl-CoA C-acetyltransferase
MQNDELVIVAAKRTPSGNMSGQFSSLTASDLGAIAFKAAIEEANIKPDDIDEVIAGCVLQAGIGQAPARQAARGANLPDKVGATTINKMCGSGMKALMLASDMIKAGSANMIVCGGMESMTNAPYLLKKARQGYRLGHDKILDHMFLDGLEDAYDKGKLMGVFAEDTATHFNFSREMQDEFAQTSLTRALNAQTKGLFADEIAPVNVKTRKEAFIIDKDEGPDESKFEKIPRLKPAFKKEGTVTAANSSTIADGASALIVTTLSHAKKLNLTPLATIRGYNSFAQAPAWFTTAPIHAITDLLKTCQWEKDDVSLFEINEAFAVVTMAAMSELNLPQSKVNVRGGACALGHPIGASGARILVTLIHALKSGQKGVAALCIGGGEATAFAIEKI